MAMKRTRTEDRKLRKTRIRRKVTGTMERPRLNIYKSHKNYCAQVIDDTAGKTLVTVTTQESDLRAKFTTRGNMVAAKAVGSLIAERSLAKGIKKVIFDRGGNRFHGAVKALADAARGSGLEF
ncbi:50S ribosomal protein L18 [bacterium]|nr:50S ribosomal protein L18 [bacterium]